MNFKRGFYWILFVFGILCLVDVIFLIALNAAINVGTAFPVIFGILLIWFSYLKLFKKIRIFKNIFLSRAIVICIALFIISFISIEALIWTSTADERSNKVDFVILLGAGLKGDKITATFMNRMENCVEYLEANPEAKVVVTGGQGHGEIISEAEAMKRYLLEKNIREDRIFKEDKATSTFENFKYSKLILNQKYNNSDYYTIMIITSDFHMFRAKMLAKRNGFIAFGMPAKTWWGVFPNSCVREYFAVVKSYFIDR